MVMHHKICLIAMIIGTVLVGGEMFPSIVQAETVIRVGGTGSALGAMKQLATEYKKSHPGISIRILPSLGSAAGIKAILGGSIDLALSSRPLTENERSQGAIEQEYARSPFVFATNLKVSKKDISLRELEKIFSSPTATWPDGSRVRLILRPEKDIDSKLLRELSPTMEKGMKEAQARHGMIMAITDQEASDAIARTPGALGGATLCEIISENRQVNVLSFNGVKPNITNISNGSYPLVKSLYLVTTAQSPLDARKFAEFVRSPAAGAILTKTGHSVGKVK